MSFIYKITNTVTGEIYVGKTTLTVEERLVRHKRSSKYHDTLLYRAMRKYGTDVFIIEPLEELIIDDNLNQREKDWIVECNSKVPFGYNLTDGGDGGDTSASPAYQEALLLRDQRGDKNPMYGRRGENNPNFGSSRTEEQKSNMKKGLTTAWQQNTSRKETQARRMTGCHNPMFGQTPSNACPIEVNGVLYNSLAEASRATGLSIHFVKKQGKQTNNE